MLGWLGYRTVSFLADHLPKGLQYACASGFADLYRLTHPQTRRAVEANLKAILGSEATPSTVRAAAKTCFRHFGHSICELMGTRRFGTKFLEQHMEVRGLEHIDAALAQGKGVLLVSGHFSNWEMGGAELARRGTPVLYVVQPQRDPRAHRFFVERRAERGIEVATTEVAGRSILRTLRQNRAVAILADRGTGGPTIDVEIFGRTLATPQGPWRSAEYTGAPVVPGFVTRKADKTFRLEFHPAVSAGEGSPESFQARLAQAWTRVFEAQLRASPEQWVMFFPAFENLSAPRSAKPALSKGWGAEASASAPEWALAHAGAGTSSREERA